MDKKKNKGKKKEIDRKTVVRREKMILVAIVGILIMVGAFFVIRLLNPVPEEAFSEEESSGEELNVGAETEESPVPRPDLDVQLLTVNEYSRPGIPTDTITGIVVHYTANPGSTAQENRDYFESLKDSHETKVSSNFIVGLEGEIIQCIPTSEIAYASNSRNSDTVSIECCHPDETGEFTEATYDSLVHLTAFLCGKFGLTADSVIRHYDVTGKDCPKYFVEHEDAWLQFKADVAAYLEEYGV